MPEGPPAPRNSSPSSTWLSENLFIFASPIVAYVLSYAYAYGYDHYFYIPDDLIQVDTTQLLGFLAAILVLLKKRFFLLSIGGLSTSLRVPFIYIIPSLFLSLNIYFVTDNVQYALIAASVSLLLTSVILTIDKLFTIFRRYSEDKQKNISASRFIVWLMWVPWENYAAKCKECNEQGSLKQAMILFGWIIYFKVETRLFKLLDEVRKWGYVKPETARRKSPESGFKWYPMFGVFDIAAYTRTGDVLSVEQIRMLQGIILACFFFLYLGRHNAETQVDFDVLANEPPTIVMEISEKRFIGIKYFELMRSLEGRLQVYDLPFSDKKHGFKIARKSIGPLTGGDESVF